jgi:ABC-type phosphate/phosphonate transport system substrate-binding protein
MYDLPTLRRAMDSWWAGLGAHFRRAGVKGVPHCLSRPGEGFDFWLAPDLLISQSCGYPLVTRLAGRVTLLGTPCYDVDGCEGSDYRSFVIVRGDCPAKSIADLRGRRCAVNMPESWSGHHALRLAAAPLIEDGRPVFEVLCSGSHVASIDAVCSGAADFAAIDCVVFGLLSRSRPQATESLRILARTPTMTGLPFIAGGAASKDDILRLKQGLREAFDDTALRDVREQLRLKDVRFTASSDYRRLSAALKRLEVQRIPQFV